MKRVLIIEDEKSLVRFIQLELEHRAIFRRIELQDHQDRVILTFRDITVDLDARVVTRGGNPVELTKRGFDLLAVFMKHPNLVQTRDMLLDLVWGYDSLVERIVVDVYIRYLRNKQDVPGEESVIQTVRGMGYVLRP
ncbi:winged helix-turn-helix domain-containing protein [Paenibacillus dokdonensis]|uniref:winged helix-turn-helix domain-containing protein n=1 Tax=Paenibacillus dokdonensis TaxID=2567944 RepID=UPI0010A7661F|nr:response regulator transcription factor [Paenibacillus dokdonensis]